MTGTNNRIAAFVLLSLGLHALLLVPGIGKQLTASVTPSLGTLSVSLQSPPSKTANKRSRPVLQQAAIAETATQEPERPSAKTRPHTTDTREQTAVPSHAANQVRRELQARLQTQFEYPLMAVRHGWQGDVQLSFRVLANGTLTNIQVAHSSGYALLDRSAIETLRRVHRLHGSERWLHGQHLDMTMPIRYQLTEG